VEDRFLQKRKLASRRYSSLARSTLNKLEKNVLTAKGLAKPPEEINQAIDEAYEKVLSILERGYDKGAVLGQEFAESELSQFGVPPPPLTKEANPQYQGFVDGLHTKFETCRESLLRYDEPKFAITALRKSVNGYMATIVEHAFTAQQLNVYKHAAFNTAVPKEYERPDRGKAFFFLAPIVFAVAHFVISAIKTAADLLRHLVEFLISHRPRKLWTTYGPACRRCERLVGEQVELFEPFPYPGQHGPPLHPNCDCHVKIVFHGEHTILGMLRDITGYD
jgi:hypothetical protein